MAAPPYCAPIASVAVTYVTEPACPRSWALEPALRRLETQLVGGLELAYALVPRRYQEGEAAGWLEASAQSGMPVDVRLWLESPPRSSHLACYAVKAAAEQGRAAPLLRRLREGFAVDRRPQASVEALVELARGVSGLDVDRYRRSLGSDAIVEALARDVEQAREHGVDADAGLPTPLLLLDDVALGEPASWRAALIAAGAEASAGGPGVLEALARYGRMATVEVAAVCDLTPPVAAAQLWQLALELRVVAERTVGGELWRAAA